MLNKNKKIKKGQLAGFQKRVKRVFGLNTTLKEQLSNLKTMTENAEKSGNPEWVNAEIVEEIALEATRYLNRAINELQYLIRDCYPDEIRRGADKALGRGASAVYVLPMITNSIWLMRALLPLSGGAETIGAQFRRVLCEKRPDLFSHQPLDMEMDLRYQGLPCCIGLAMDIKAINRCLDWVAEHDGLVGAERCGFAIACFEWQVAYYRCLFPDTATIVAVEATDEDTLEAEEYPPPEE